MKEKKWLVIALTQLLSILILVETPNILLIICGMFAGGSSDLTALEMCKAVFFTKVFFQSDLIMLPLLPVIAILALTFIYSLYRFWKAQKE